MRENIECLRETDPTLGSPDTLPPDSESGQVLIPTNELIHQGPFPGLIPHWRHFRRLRGVGHSDLAAGHAQTRRGSVVMLASMPETDPIKRVPMGGWQPTSDPDTHATIWLVFPRGATFRYEAEVMRAGQKLEILAGPTREDVADQ